MKAGWAGWSWATRLRSSGDVAIKRIHPDRYGDAAVESLLHEALYTGSLEHPHIVPVHLLAKGPTGEPLLVMKRVEGVSWQELIANPAHPEGARYAGVAVRLDAPPVREFAGTPSYMAPEMLEGTARISARTDVYLLGGILHEVLTGKPRHTGATTRQVLLAARVSAPVDYSPLVPMELAALCNRATAPDPADRPDSAVAFRQALLDYLQHRGSLGLSATGEARLTALTHEVAAVASDGASPQALGAVRRLAAESAFAFRHALRDWDANEQARQGLRQCLEATIAFEITQRNPVGAGVLLAELLEMGREEPEIAGRLAGLEAEMAEEALAQGKLRRLEHEANAGFAIEQRSGFLILAHVLTGVAWAALAEAGLVVTPTVILGQSTSLFVGLCVTLYFLRIRLMANRYNRRFLYCIMAFCGFCMMLAGLSLIGNIPIAPLTVAAYGGISLMFAVMAIAMSPWVGLMVPPSVCGAFFVALFPEQVTASLATFNFACAVMWAIQWMVIRRPGGSLAPQAPK